jgi:hypothetical protein
MSNCVCQGTGKCQCPPKTSEEITVENGRVIKRTTTDLGPFVWPKPTTEQNEESKGPEFLTE